MSDLPPIPALDVLDVLHRIVTACVPEAGAVGAAPPTRQAILDAANTGLQALLSGPLSAAAPAELARLVAEMKAYGSFRPPSQPIPSLSLGSSSVVAWIDDGSDASDLELHVRGGLLLDPAGKDPWEDIAAFAHVELPGLMQPDGDVWQIIADVRAALGLDARRQDDLGLPAGTLPGPWSAVEQAPPVDLEQLVGRLLRFSIRLAREGWAAEAWDEIDRLFLEGLPTVFASMFTLQGARVHIHVDAGRHTADAHAYTLRFSRDGQHPGSLGALRGRLELRITRKHLVAAAKLLGELLSRSRFGSPLKGAGLKAPLLRLAALQAHASDAGVWDVSAVLLKLVALTEARIAAGKPVLDDDMVEDQLRACVRGAVRAVSIDGVGLAPVQTHFNLTGPTSVGWTQVVALQLPQHPQAWRQRATSRLEIPKADFAAQIQDWADLFVAAEHLPPPP